MTNRQTTTPGNNSCVVQMDLDPVVLQVCLDPPASNWESGSGQNKPATQCVSEGPQIYQNVASQNKENFWMNDNNGPKDDLPIIWNDQENELNELILEQTKAMQRGKAVDVEDLPHDRLQHTRRLLQVVHEDVGDLHLKLAGNITQFNHVNKCSWHVQAYAQSTATCAKEVDQYVDNRASFVGRRQHVDGSQTENPGGIRRSINNRGSTSHLSRTRRCSFEEWIYRKGQAYVRYVCGAPPTPASPSRDFLLLVGLTLFLFPGPYAILALAMAILTRLDNAKHRYKDAYYKSFFILYFLACAIVVSIIEMTFA